MKAALHPRENIDRRRLNQAHFYIGAFPRLNGEDKHVEKHFEAPISFEMFNAIKRATAQVHLQKLRE